MFFLLPKRQISNKGFQKLFDCIVDDLLLAKLSAYGFDYNSEELINSFLSGRKLRTKKGSSCSQSRLCVLRKDQSKVLFYIHIHVLSFSMRLLI